MTSAIETFRPVPLAGTSPDSALSADRVERVLRAGLGIQVALLLPSLLAYGLDDRLINGISVWSKPLKFQSSLIVLIGTILLLLPLISREALAGYFARATAAVLALASTLEIAYITLQAARGRASHFNDATPIEGMLYSLMGLGAVAIVLCCFVFGWLIWRNGRSDAGMGLRLGAASGLMLGAVLTLVTAGVLGSGAIDGPGHWVGGTRTDTGGLFLLGWSRTGGDLRVPHFFATHIMQALPLLGLLLDRWAPNRVRAGMLVGAILGTVIVAATFLQAVSGRPFI